MLLFCPSCSNALVVEESSSKGYGGYQFACQSCPYVYPIRKPVTHRIYPKLKEIDDVLGGANAWENAQITDADCPKCGAKRAYFFQLQTRSADEPMTTFYRCQNAECAHYWRD